MLSPVSLSSIHVSVCPPPPCLSSHNRESAIPSAQDPKARSHLPLLPHSTTGHLSSSKAPFFQLLNLLHLFFFDLPWPHSRLSLGPTSLPLLVQTSQKSQSLLSHPTLAPQPTAVGLSPPLTHRAFLLQIDMYNFYFPRTLCSTYFFCSKMHVT